MAVFDQLWFYFLATLVAGVILGVLLARLLSDRYAHVREVRWQRRFSETQTEHELSIGKLNKTLRHAQEKQETLRQALAESDETVRLLSDDSKLAFKQDVAERNLRIAELEKRLSRARAKVADARDEEAMLQKQIDNLQTELGRRDRRIDGLLAKISQESESPLSPQQRVADIGTLEKDPIREDQGIARVVSIHEYRQSDDLTATTPADPEGHDDTEQRIRLLERELEEWKHKYETANGRDRIVSDISVANSERHRLPAKKDPLKDDLKRIRGIGPVLETALNEMGIFQFEQLAQMTQPDIERMGRYDGSLPGRIRRYKWTEQARRLQETPDHHSSRV